MLWDDGHSNQFYFIVPGLVRSTFDETMNTKDIPSTGVRYLEVRSTQAGQRVDNFLLHQLKGVPRSRIYRMLRNGEVRVNKGRVKPTYRIASGDRIRLPPVRRANDLAVATVVPGGVAERLKTAILHEDKDLLILNKPSGLAVHGGSRLQYGLIEALRQTRSATEMLELAHRLDRATSGCLLIAKTRAALTALHQMLREGKIEKRYTALVAGRWHGGARGVSVAIAKRASGTHGRMVGIAANGKTAETWFKPCEYFDDCSLMTVRIYTGRTHQIRVHAAHVGHPLVGDDKYGDYALNKKMRKRGLKRLFLHASQLQFHMPDTNRSYTIDAPLPDTLRQFLDTLEPQ